MRFKSEELASTLADGAFYRTEGQPLFVVALVDHLAMDGDILDIEEVCERLVRSTGLLRATGVSEWPAGRVSGEYTFIHALYQQVLYEATLTRAPGQRPSQAGREP